MRDILHVTNKIPSFFAVYELEFYSSCFVVLGLAGGVRILEEFSWLREQEEIGQDQKNWYDQLEENCHFCREERAKSCIY